MFERAHQQITIRRACRHSYCADGNVAEKLFQRKKNVLARGVGIYRVVSSQQRPLKNEIRIAMRERVVPHLHAGKSPRPCRVGNVVRRRADFGEINRQIFLTPPVISQFYYNIELLTFIES